MSHKLNLTKISVLSLTFLSILIFSLFLIVPTAFAVCPICTVAVGAGLGLSRYLGIDDTITSIWIGGLLISSYFWLLDILQRKKTKFPIHKYRYLIFSILYGLVLIPLWLGGFIGHPFNTILGIDKIIFGTFLGTVTFLTGVWLDKKVRQIKGKQLFLYQKVVFPLSTLVLTSLIIYYYGGYLY